MSAFKGTPGPWAVVADPFDGLTIESRNDRDMADQPVFYRLAADIGGRVHGDNCDDYSEVEANALLISAAPELLKELTHLYRCLRPWIEAGHAVPGIATLNGAEAAISKATGGDA